MFFLSDLDLAAYYEKNKKRYFNILNLRRSNETTDKKYNTPWNTYFKIAFHYSGFNSAQLEPQKRQNLSLTYTLNVNYNKTYLSQSSRGIWQYGGLVLISSHTFALFSTTQTLKNTEHKK